MHTLAQIDRKLGWVWRFRGDKVGHNTFAAKSEKIDVGFDLINYGFEFDANDSFVEKVV